MSAAPPFVHLHTHTEYSELDGLSRVRPLVARAKSLGQEALAITDHGNLYGAIQFYRAAEAEGVHPILGLETYVAAGDRRDREGGRESNSNSSHLVLLAQNNTGWRNLIQLASKAHLEGFYYRPRVDHELLAEYSEGLIVLSGCPSGELQRALIAEDLEQARGVAEWYREVFGDRYYLEIQRHQELGQFEPALRQTVKLSEEMGIPLVATQDAHYCEPGDHDAHDLLLCIGTNATRDEEKRFRFDGEDFYLTESDYMAELFADVPQAVTNTMAVAERCAVELEFGRLKLPTPPNLPDGASALEHLHDLAWKGLEQRAPNPPQSYQERLKYELSVVEETGFEEYFLIVRDFSQFALERGIAKTVRGSAAASLVLYCLGITDIDPLEHSLVFERFLNPERREMPDIDMDFADQRRDEVIAYVADKYGRDRVAQIITFGTLGAKAAIRDSGRALGMPLGETDRLARMVPHQLNITVAEAKKLSPELEAAVQTDTAAAEVVGYAERLNGVVRNVSTHAAGVVISQDPLAENVPLRRPVNDTGGDAPIPMTQWAMDEVGAVGLLKMDFLGLANLTILEEAAKLAAESGQGEIDYLTLPDGDAKTYEMLGRGETFGVFQLESGGMRRVVEEMKPNSIRDLAALLALYRPGPMEHIPRYIAVKHGREQAVYPHPDLAEVLDETHGVIVYQDQVLQIARKFGGYTLGQADVMRKAMGKKIAEVMRAERGRFVSGAEALGYTERDANTIFELIEPFAGYAFNKAHAVSYAAIAYQTAWFKANLPGPYMAAVLRSAAGNSDRLREATAECGRLQIPLLLPDVNRSQSSFTLETLADGREAIRFGLGVIKGVGMAAIEPLLEDRETNGRFETFIDLCDRIDPKTLNRRALESMAKAGVFDELKPRGEMVVLADAVLKQARRAQELRDSGQTTMFDLFGSEVATPTPTVQLLEGDEVIDVTPAEQLQWERELLGAYVSQHPLQAASQALRDRVNATVSELTEELDGRTVTVACLVNGVRERPTRKGELFGAVDVEDLSGTGEVTVWPEQYRKTKDLWQPNRVVVARVTVRLRGDRLNLVVESAEGWDQEEAEKQEALRAEPADPGAMRPPKVVEAKKTVQAVKAAEPSPPPAAPAPVAPPAAQPIRPVQPEPSLETGERSLWITLAESSDAATDAEAMGRIEQLLTAYRLIDDGEKLDVYLRIRHGGGQGGETVLALGAEWRTGANAAMVTQLRSAAGEGGGAEVRATETAAAGGAAAG